MKPLLIVLWIFIAAVAAYDVALTFRFASEFPGCEWNPLMRWLIVHCGLDGAIGIKWLTNMVMFLALVLSAKRWPRKCLLFSIAVAVAQGLLLAVFWM